MRVFLGAAFILLLVQAGAAVPFNAETGPGGIADTGRRAISPQDTLRALVVFIRFRDDAEEWPGGCSRGGREWASPDRLPDMARTILHPDPRGPYADSSLTDYFYQQSNRNFILFGDTHPEIYTTRHDEAHYQRLNQHGLGILTDEIMEALADRYDFSEYDTNGDGYIDQLMVIIRNMQSGPGFGGIASLGTADYAREYNGKRLHPRLGGFFLIWRRGYNVHPQVDLTRWMAHEFGHNLWPEFEGGHLNPIRTNDVPHASTASDAPERVVGYALMLGAGTRTADIAGHRIISAYERSLLEGWIECRAITSSGTVVLRDLYSASSDNCAVVPLEGGVRRLYLSNLQRVSYFDRNHRPPSSHCGGCFQIDQGLMATGLFAEIVDGSTARATRDFLPANNFAAAPTDCQWPHAHGVYEGNTYGEGAQLTPWTKPNINGYTNYPQGYAPSWYAVDNIRYTGGDGREMAFDFIEDFRVDPVIRANSWIGRESENETIHGELHVEQGATLTISGTRLMLAEGASVVVAGTLLIDGSTLTSDDTWRGITILRGGAVRIENASEVLRMVAEVDVRPGGSLVISDDSSVSRASR